MTIAKPTVGSTGWNTATDAVIDAVNNLTIAASSAVLSVNARTGTVTGLAEDNTVVHTTGAETVAGVKTFSSAPVVPSASFPESAVANLTTDLAAKLSLTGGTLTGALTLAADPTANLRAATKQYVDNRASTFNVRAYGAVLDGTTDDTAAVQAALDAAVATGKRAVVRIADGTAHITSVTLSGPLVDIVGPGTVTGKIVVGTTTHQTMGSSIRGVRFEQTGLGAGSSGIELMSIERFDISDCYFTGMDAAVRVPAFVPTGTSINQHTSRIKINDNTMWNVNNALYVRLDASMQWLSFADTDFRGNTILSVVNGVDIESVDGFKCVDNTFFKISYPAADTTKQCNVLIGKNDWLVIQGNNLFEAGFEAINLTEPKDFNITGNNIAWCGQRQTSDAILITIPTGAYASGQITGNHAADFTGNYVTVTGAGNASRVVFGANNLYMSANTPASYYGGTPLPTTRFRYLGDTTLSSQPIVTDAVQAMASISTDSINNRQLESSRRVSATEQINARPASRTITASTPSAVATITSTIGGAGNPYGGLVHVYVQASSDATKAASYLLHVGSGGSGAGRSLTSVAADGMTTGASASHPSFTWSLNSSDQLVATPVGSTAGSFQFSLNSMGTMILA